MTKRMLIAALAILPIIPAFGQPGPPFRGGHNRLEYLAGYLGLTEAQKQQAQPIFDASREASATIMGQMTSAREALGAAIKAGQPDADLDRLAAAVGTVHGQMEAIQAKAESKFYQLLTADQKQKYDQLGTRGGWGGPGGPGGRGFGRRPNQ